MLAIAGHDQSTPRVASSPHLVESAELERLVDRILPWLASAQTTVAAAAAAHRGAAVKEQRLRMRQESIKALRCIMRTVIQCAASRPRNAAGAIEYEKEALFLLYSKNPVYSALASMGGFFTSADFEKLKADVRAAENEEQTRLAHDAVTPSERVEARLLPHFATLEQLLM